jgi:hypothetical protein
MAMRGVSLSGDTRLTYREAVALLHAVEAMKQDPPGYYAQAHGGEEWKSFLGAIAKLRQALRYAGGYDERVDELVNPFKK